MTFTAISEIPFHLRDYKLVTGNDVSGPNDSAIDAAAAATCGLTTERHDEPHGLGPDGRVRNTKLFTK